MNNTKIILTGILGLVLGGGVGYLTASKLLKQHYEAKLLLELEELKTLYSTDEGEHEVIYYVPEDDGIESLLEVKEEVGEDDINFFDQARELSRERESNAVAYNKIIADSRYRAEKEKEAGTFDDEPLYDAEGNTPYDKYVFEEDPTAAPIYDTPYHIPSEEFTNNPAYDVVYYTYYVNDGVVVNDEDDAVVMNVKEFLGPFWTDGLNRYDENKSWFKNDMDMTYYEVLNSDDHFDQIS